jgi:phosphoribosylamine---glycine ligase
MNVLVVGGGGREHAICWAISKSNILTNLHAIPGNPGISKIAACHDVDPNDFAEVLEFCHINHIAFVIIGPEQYLVKGIVSFLSDHNIKVFGCSAQAAQLESSKSFTKNLCNKLNIKTADHKTFQDKHSALSYLDGHDQFPLVLKTDALAAGKGVIIANNLLEAQIAVDEIYSAKYNDSNVIVIEEFITGVEASFFVISDGTKARVLASAGDYKKIGEGDVGKNTGGMGTYSPSHVIPLKLEKDIMRDVINPTLTFMKEQGMPYVGFLYAGFIINEDGIFLLEYNARMGDPEAQSIVTRLDSDLLDILVKAVNGQIEQAEIRLKNNKSVTVVLAANGYPDSYRKYTKINNLEKLDNLPEIVLFHAGTKVVDGQLVANGGRVLAVNAVADSFELARDKVYKAIDLIDWDDSCYRRDIAKNIIG